MSNYVQGNRGFKMGMKSFFQENRRCKRSLANSHHLFSFKKSNQFPESVFLCKASAGYVDEVTACSWNDRVVASDDLVLVEFWAPGCTPTHLIEPIIVSELAKENAVKLVCYKLNTEKCPSVALQYEIKNIPTVILFKDGEIKVRSHDRISKSALRSAIQECFK